MSFIFLFWVCWAGRVSQPRQKIGHIIETSFGINSDLGAGRGVFVHRCGISVGEIMCNYY